MLGVPLGFGSFFTQKFAFTIATRGVLACPSPRSCAKSNLIDWAIDELLAITSVGAPTSFDVASKSP
jgi:ABC-type uncharacterized transport system YnjBCD ATPase subunit